MITAVGKAKLPILPPKQFTGNLETATIVERREKLTEYMGELLSTRDVHSNPSADSLVDDFFGLRRQKAVQNPEIRSSFDMSSGH